DDDKDSRRRKGDDDDGSRRRIVKDDSQLHWLSALQSYAEEQAKLAKKAQHAQETDSYQQWLSGALTAGMGPVYRALKSHEQTLARPFRDQSALARSYCRMEFWGHIWNASILPPQGVFSDERLALRAEASKQAQALPPLSTEQVKIACMATGNKKGGLDGWTYRALRNLPDFSYQQLAELFRFVETELSLPIQMQAVQVVSLAKSPEKGISEHPGVSPAVLWIDDISVDISHADPEVAASLALSAARKLEDLLSIEKLSINKTKTKFGVNNTKEAKALNNMRGEGDPQVTDLVRDLGVDSVELAPSVLPEPPTEAAKGVKERHRTSGGERRRDLDWRRKQRQVLDLRRKQYPRRRRLGQEQEQLEQHTDLRHYMYLIAQMQRPLSSSGVSSVGSPQGLPMEAVPRAEDQAVDASMSSEEPMELRLSGKDITNRPALPYPVGLTGIHEGASPPGDVVAAFFPQTLELWCDLATQERQEPVQLQRLQAGKSRAVYDFVPTRSYVLKLSMEHGHGREMEVASSLPGITPATEAFDKILMKLYWQREDTEYLLLTEVLKQAKVTPLNQAWPNVIPETVVIQAGIIIAFAAKLWQVRDLGSYNLAVMDTSELGYKLCILDMADWVPWGQRYPVFPGKQNARGLLTFVRHGHSEGFLRLFESFAGQDPDTVLQALRPRLTSQAERALREQGVFD
ncbi:unnamed protein product, partial [Symbiodinium sp. KB8]